MNGAARLKLVAPWLHVTVWPHVEAGGLDQVQVSCVLCQASHALPVDVADRWIGRVMGELTHATTCPVPGHTAKAYAARWN
jgi:hypothetical protein